MSTLNNIVRAGEVVCILSLANCNGNVAATATGGTGAVSTSTATGGSTTGAASTTTTSGGSTAVAASASGGSSADLGSGGTTSIGGTPSSDTSAALDSGTEDASTLQQCPAPVLADAGASDAGVLIWPSCTPGDKCACNAFQTGCPSSQVCFDIGNWMACHCATCNLQLVADACSWVLESSDGLYEVNLHSWADAVYKAGGDGGTTNLPYVDSPAACTDQGGWYAVGSNYASIRTGTLYGTQTLATTMTFTLCPTSCIEHQQSPDTIFELQRGWCNRAID